MLTLDAKDAEDQALIAYAERIVRLLASPEAQKNHFFVSTLDDFLGALYALVFAKHNDPPFENRNRPIEVLAVIKRAENVASRTIRTSGKWLAGFHFNSALFRIAATYHRGLKVVSSKEMDKNIWKEALLKIIEPRFPGWMHNELDDIYAEVNQLKHDGNGIYLSRSVTWTQAVASVGELIELFDLWMSERGKWK